MKLAAFFALCFAVAPVPALEREGNAITLDDGEVKQCIEGGGCVFVTRRSLFEAIEREAKKRAGNCMGAS